MLPISHADIAKAHALSETRKSLGLTQMQLSEKTGVAQCDISRIERGRANPSLKTLMRLAAGLGMTVKVEYLPHGFR